MNWDEYLAKLSPSKRIIAQSLKDDGVDEERIKNFYHKVKGKDSTDKTIPIKNAFARLIYKVKKIDGKQKVSDEPKDNATIRATITELRRLCAEVEENILEK